MKICNNCNTPNEVHAEKCIHCNMRGNFTLHAVPTDFKPEEPKASFECPNCAAPDPGEELRCRYCKFPLEGTARMTYMRDRNNLKQSNNA